MIPVLSRLQSRGVLSLVLMLCLLPLRSGAEDAPSAAAQQYQLPSLPRPALPPSSFELQTGQSASPLQPEIALPTLPPIALPPAAAESTPLTVPPAPIAEPVSPAFQPAIEPVAVPEVVPLNQQINTTISIADMGQAKGLMLSGGQLQSGIIFTLPGDQVVTHAQLQLALKVSPALAARDNNLQLMLNGQSLGTLTLHKDSSVDNQYQLEIPAAMVVGNNNLSFIIGGADSLQCENVATDAYWVNILPSTRLQLESQVLNTGLDLGNFPRPFFDPMLMTETRISAVFSSGMTADEVNAAAIVTSYLGRQSDYRDINFPVLIDALPEKNGMVFAKPGNKIGGYTVPSVDGPQILKIDNPQNPVFKLLLVMGRNESELRQAAFRLVSEPLPKNSSSLAVKPVTIPQRKPYDAPRWINTESPVYLRHLVPGIDDLTVDGLYHDGIRIPFRAAPDLFMWDGDSIPIQIGYRFPAEPWIDEGSSMLNVSINGTFLRNLSVNKNGLVENIWRLLGGDTRRESYLLNLPPYLIYGDNQLEFYFSIKAKPDTPCNLLANNNIKSRIDTDSYIDLSQTHHFSQLPNLSFYVGASFPFSRLADFSQTLLLLPEKPSAAEIGMLLNLTARAGKATGIPVSNVNLRFGLPADAAQSPLFKGKDILVVSTLQHGEFYQRLLSGSPFTFGNGSLSIADWPALARLKAYLGGDWFRQNTEADRYLDSTGKWRGFFSFRSLWDPERVVVVAAATDGDELGKIYTDLQLAKLNAGIRGDLAVITDESGVRSFRVGGQFPSGEMPWYMMVMWYASQHIITLSLAALLIAVLVGWGTYTLLRRHAAQRLGYDPENHEK